MVIILKIQWIVEKKRLQYIWLDIGAMLCLFPFHLPEYVVPSFYVNFRVQNMGD